MKPTHYFITLVAFLVALVLSSCGVFSNSKLLVPIEAKAINTYCAQLRAFQINPAADVNAFQMQIRAEHDAALRKNGATGLVRITCDK